ncbi:SIS domain-containing protein [Candidatus Kaiserbacteria bacterium]|nr:SIS domain-containing protein [Candidatus Kaiserbacteria bacterium]
MAGKLGFFGGIFRRHSEIVEQSMRHILLDVEQGGALLLHALKAKRKVLVCGNGGSAADSQHFAAELVGRFVKNRKALPAVALTVDSSALTAIANDWEFDHVFARQVEALGNAGDVLVVFTTSGRSKNILAAIRAARKQRMRIIVLTGEKGKELRKNVDACIVVPSRETARIQEIHELTFHAWCESLENTFRS